MGFRGFLIKTKPASQHPVLTCPSYRAKGTLNTEPVIWHLPVLDPMRRTPQPRCNPRSLSYGLVHQQPGTYIQDSVMAFVVLFPESKSQPSCLVSLVVRREGWVWKIQVPESGICVFLGPRQVLLVSRPAQFPAPWPLTMPSR